MSQLNVAPPPYTLRTGAQYHFARGCKIIALASAAPMRDNATKAKDARMDIPTEIARMEAAVLAMGLPISQLYNAAGIHHATWYRLRSGKIKRTWPETWARVVTAFDDLVKGAGK